MGGLIGDRKEVGVSGVYGLLFALPEKASTTHDVNTLLKICDVLASNLPATAALCYFMADVVDQPSESLMRSHKPFPPRPPRWMPPSRVS